MGSAEFSRPEIVDSRECDRQGTIGTYVPRLSTVSLGISRHPFLDLVGCSHFELPVDVLLPFDSEYQQQLSLAGLDLNTQCNPLVQDLEVDGCYDSTVPFMWEDFTAAIDCDVVPESSALHAIRANELNGIPLFRDIECNVFSSQDVAANDLPGMLEHTIASFNPQVAAAEEKAIAARAARAKRKEKRKLAKLQRANVPPLKRQRRAHVLKEGSLSLIVYGQDEKLKWTRRICDFLGKMRIVLGDRRMGPMPWGGSVLDSVVGAFLTQNVADTLSSKAFMMLASQFPAVRRRAARHKQRTAPNLLCDCADRECGGQHVQKWACRSDRNQTTARHHSRAQEPAARMTDGSSAEHVHGDHAVVHNSCQLAHCLPVDCGCANEMCARHHQCIENGPGTREHDVLLCESYHLPLSAPSSGDFSDVVNWEAVCAAPKELVANCIRCRGMHNRLTSRIQAFLAHVGKEQGEVGKERMLWKKQETTEGHLVPHSSPQSISASPRPLPPDRNNLSHSAEGLSIEWLRDVGDEDMKQFLTSVAGLGWKSCACVALLALGRKDFPVDINVARICTRLGWVPLEAQAGIEELEDYPSAMEIQKYLHSRAMAFDFPTLYELHYHMITLGKVLCTKRKPNCLACPLASSCEYALNGGEHYQPENRYPGKPKSNKTRRTAKPMRKDELGQKEPQCAGTGTVAQRLADHSFTNEHLPSQASTLKSGGMVYRQVPDIEDFFSVHGAAACATMVHVPKGEESRKECETTADRQDRHVSDRQLKTEPCQNDKPEHGLRFAQPQVSKSPAGKEDGSGTQQASGPAGSDRLQCNTAEVQRIISILEEQESHVILDKVHCQDALGGHVGVALAMKIVGINSGHRIDQAQLRSEYRRISKLIHPDKCLHPLAGMAFSVLTDAFKALHSSTGSTPGDGDAVLNELTQELASGVGESSVVGVRWEQGDPCHSRKVVFGACFPDGALERIVPFSFPPRLAEDPNPYLLIPDPRNQEFEGGGRQDGRTCDGPGCRPASVNADNDTIPMLLLIPCRTALRGKFPLNGTYFQVNELFLCDPTTTPPIRLARRLLEMHNPRWRPVYFGTSISRVTQGMTMREIAQLFRFGYVCVKGFDLGTGAPSSLIEPLLP
eukprot:evm.model.scf_657.2 EVM.evm.TU.scf_657.2   scf_657:46933-64154(-)